MKVVIVDDTHINLVLMSRLVDKLADVSTVTFQSAQQALDWCSGNPYDLLIVDYMMPDLNGLELIARLPGAPDERPPVLMVTASVDVDVRHRASWLADEVGKATAELRAREQETILLLCRASEYRDPETGAHIQRMAHYSCLIAAELGLSAAEQEDMLNAAPMHDIGKVGTPDHILLKPGRLSDDEMVIMRQHAEIGYRILKDCQARMLQLAAEIAYTHHERYDGSGYPVGHAGEQIPLVGRIVAVADVFDALTSVRPYKQAWTMDAARQYLLDNCNTHFDPQCVAALLRRWPAVEQIRARFRDEGQPA